MLRFNTLDHFIVSCDLFATAVNSLTVIHDIDNTSDHDPIVLELGVRFGLLARANKNFISKPAWHRASVADLDNYRLTLLANLHAIEIPYEAILCCNLSYCNSAHGLKLNNYANDISAACLAAADIALPMTEERRSKGTLPGWSEFVEPLREKSLFCHNMWLECGRPKTGVVADVMRRTRAAYHYAL